MIDRDVHQDVTEVLVRYATGIDRRDWDLFRACFTDACEVDYRPVGRWRGATEITESMRISHQGVGHTLHRITNSDVRAGRKGVVSRSYVDALVLGSDNLSGTRTAGYYDDELEVGENGWQIAGRRFTAVLVQVVPDGTVFDLTALMDT